MAGLILVLVYAGGVMSYSYPAAGLLILALALGLAVLLVSKPWWPWLLVIAPALSVLFTPTPAGVVRIVFYAGAAGAILLGQKFGPDRLQSALSRSGWGWLPVLALWAIGLWPDNRNIIAFWGSMFTLAATGPAMWIMAISTAALGGRSALAAVAVGLLVRYDRLRWWYIPLLLVAGVLLIALRPHTAAYRLVYWHGAITAWQSSLWLGVSPGGIGAFITEPGSSIAQVHAHNTAATWLAETGIIGLFLSIAALAALAGYTEPGRWQRGAMAAIIIQCTVDDLIWWPGPMIFSGLLFGSTMIRKDCKYGYHQIRDQFCQKYWQRGGRWQPQQTQKQTPHPTAGQPK